ncbi:hypothetical protein AB0N65_11575 [Paenarthrobacter sp. NPDC089322]|uniref:hypothetical protein n=1 Tax=Paenarthrobacter sp. NPDC089322 TaxID=3155065 RepID=UPI00343B0073
MLIREAKDRLEQMLANIDVVEGSNTVSLGAVMKAFQSFAAVSASDCAPVDEDGDGILAQFGTYGLRGTQEFSVNLSRQFIETGDDGSIWQLSCTFYWDPTPDTTALGSGSLWSFDTSPEDFFRDAALLAGWKWALGTNQRPISLDVTFDMA